MSALRNPSPAARQAFSGHAVRLVGGLCMLVVAAGCASTKVTDRQQIVSGQLTRPGLIWVYDFVASADAVPADSTLAREFAVEATPQSAEQLEMGRQLGASIAAELTEQIRAMGMPAEQVSARTIHETNDLVIRGYLVSIDEGSAAKRVGIGFGAGGSALRTVVEGLQVTPQGLRKLGSGTVEAGSNKTPGGAMGAATFIATANPAGLIVSSGMKAYGEVSGSSKVEGRAKATAEEIAKVLKQRFHEQGWIQ